MIKTYYVYIGDHPKTGLPFYVGKGIHVGLGGYNRFNSHNYSLRKGNHGNRRLQRAHNKYGPITWTAVRCGITEKEAFETERSLIAYWGKKMLCNMTDGGEGGSGYRHTEAAVLKMRVAVTGRQMSPEARAKIGASSKRLAECPDRRAKMLASIHGAEARAKASAKLKGRIFTAGHRANIAVSNRGKIIPAEVRAKFAAAKKGKKRGPPSAETRAKMSAALKGRPGRRQTPEIRAKISEGMKAFRSGALLM